MNVFEMNRFHKGLHATIDLQWEPTILSVLQEYLTTIMVNQYTIQENCRYIVLDVFKKFVATVVKIWTLFSRSNLTQSSTDSYPDELCATERTAWHSYHDRFQSSTVQHCPRRGCV